MAVQDGQDEGAGAAEVRPAEIARAGSVITRLAGLTPFKVSG